MMKREFLVDRLGKSFVLYAGLLDEAHSQGLKSIHTHLIQAPTAENGMMAICSAEIVTDRGTFSGIGDASPDNVSRMMVPHILRMAETRAKARALRDAVNVGVAALEELGDPDDSELREGVPSVVRPTSDAGTSRVATRGTAAGPAAADGSSVSKPAGTPVQSRSRPAESLRPGARAEAEGRIAENPASAHGGGRPARSESAAARVDTGPQPEDERATPQQIRAIFGIARADRGLSEAESRERSIALFGTQPEELTKKQASSFISSLQRVDTPS